VAIWFVHYKVFETRNRSLEEIEITLRKRAGEIGQEFITGK
jgi:hypothetical protein